MVGSDMNAPLRLEKSLAQPFERRLCANPAAAVLIRKENLR
jgi:hypothetical protein